MTEQDLEKALHPVWEGSLIYDESVMFYPDGESGTVMPAPLLYEPAEIFRVCSMDHSILYEPEKDYCIKDGCLVLMEGSAIPAWEFDDFYRKKASAIPIYSTLVPGRFLPVQECALLAKRQVLVTYQRTGGGDLLYVPADMLDRLPFFHKKLKDKSDVLIVYYGDSIMFGCDASGLHHSPPDMPVFTQLVTHMLRRIYQLPMKGINTSEGGKTSRWGREAAEKRVALYHPDLVVLGFGMNDAGEGIGCEEYEDNIRSIINTVRQKKETAEFLLVSTTLPNEECAGWLKGQAYLQRGLEKICRDTPGTVLVPMTDMHKELLSRKRYADMTGNMVNHPNDYLARIYAQVILRILGVTGCAVDSGFGGFER